SPISKQLNASEASVDELENGLSNIRTRLEEIGQASSNFNDLTKAQQEEVNLLSESQQTLEQVIAARKQQATLQTTIVSGYKAMR
ncbi:MAG TPA: hypothetical protein DD671_17065, partial [Balneolaceae bacterium]|nr:hypothetical protein [Balneolaceae bacterium]